MELVQSYHQLNSFISEIRSLRKGFISNLFLHFEKHNLWIEKKELFYQATTEGYFIFRNNSMASYLFYITTDEFQLRKGLQEITPQIKMYLANLHTSFLCNLIYPPFSRILLYSC